MKTKYILVVNGFQGAPYDLRVMIANGNDNSASLVQIVNQDAPGVTRVLIVDSEPDEYVTVINPGDLQFRDKVDILGLPPCPRCGYRLRGHPKAGSFGCDKCEVMWTVGQLENKYRGREWPPQLGMK